MVLKTNNTKVVTPLLSGYYLGEPKIRRDILRVRNEALKTQIYYSRTYRHWKPNKKERLFFLLGCVVPCVVIFLFFYTSFFLSSLTFNHGVCTFQPGRMSTGFLKRLPWYVIMTHFDILTCRFFRRGDAKPRDPRYHQTRNRLAPLLLYLSSEDGGTH